VPVVYYKNAEKEFADRFGGWLRRAWSSFVAFFRMVVQKGRQRFTVMLIPHSEKKIFNFQISFFTLVFVTLTLSVVLIGFVVLATHFTATNAQFVQADQRSQEYAATLSSFKDEIANIRKLSKSFKTNMDAVLGTIGSEAWTASGQGGPLPTAAELIDEGAAGELREISELRGISSLIRNSIEPLSEINRVMRTYQEWVDDAPTLWPLGGPYGNITTLFGWTIHPIYGVGYLHTGVDIAWSPGVPVVATANGKVTQVGYTSDLGNYVQINHKHGFVTKYGHLSAAIVSVGREVTRGTVIGYLGNTGLSTGPHLHYEVRLGVDYQDPMAYMQVKPALAAVKRDGRNGQ
jgi:murein DD-endopeptidase MepM/ murein hydrolase activator NlpD